MTQGKAIYAATAIMAIFSFMVSIFAGADFFATSKNFELAQTLASTQDVSLSKVISSSGIVESTALLRIYDAQQDELKSVRSALLQIAGDRKKNALKIVVISIVFNIFFSWLMLKLRN